MEICVGENLVDRQIVHSDGRQWPKVIVHHDRGMATVHDAPESTPWTADLSALVQSKMVIDADLEAIRAMTVKSCCTAAGSNDGPFK